ncbi:MAG: hypothetical protein K0R39_4709 [Symbiobacteriaceae bacterium]|nr:hypothetical protein [Symbiobacteriaceae bacterium]
MTEATVKLRLLLVMICRGGSAGAKVAAMYGKRAASPDGRRPQGECNWERRAGGAGTAPEDSAPGLPRIRSSARLNPGKVCDALPFQQVDQRRLTVQRPHRQSTPAYLAEHALQGEVFREENDQQNFFV